MNGRDEDEESLVSEIQHILPIGDSVEHYPSPSCICEPIKESEDRLTGDQVWRHRIVAESMQ